MRACTSDQAAAIQHLVAANVSEACAARLNASSTIAHALVWYRYGMCQAPCQADVVAVSSRLPPCRDPIHSALMELRKLCFDMSHPTTNGGRCTAADATLAKGLLKYTPVWANCSDVVGGTTLFSLSAADTTEGAKTLCPSGACTSFLDSIATALPNCQCDDAPFYGNTRAYFAYFFGCTPAARGASCAMVDLAAVSDANKLVVWANCTAFLEPASIPTFGDLSFELFAYRNQLRAVPPGFCSSTCPAFYLHVHHALPKCTQFGYPVSDTSDLFFNCPDLKRLPTCSGTYTATGLHMELSDDGTFVTSHDTNCSMTGRWTVAGQTALLTVETRRGVCSTPHVIDSMSMSSDCQQLVLSQSGTSSFLKRTADARPTMAHRAILLLCTLVSILQVLAL